MTMYQTISPPLFDIPDFPTLRRVKPLPKRRHASFNFNPEANVNITPNSTGINSPLLSQSNSHSSYISSYHTHPTQQLQPDIAHASDPLPSTVDAERSQYDWRLAPEFFLPEEILRVASVLPEPEVDDGGIGDGGDDAGEPFLPLEPKPPPTNFAPLSTTATPPPPSDISSYDEESRQLTETPYRPPFFRSLTKQHVNQDGPDRTEQLGSEVTEGELQDQFFLRTETDRLLAHADSLSARMALRSYYHSMGYSETEFGTSVGAPLAPLPPVSSSRMDHVAADYIATPPNESETFDDSINASGVTSTAHPANAVESGYVAVGVGRGHDEADGDEREDYTDHANQQGQGNTKKRKVPANVGSSPPHHHHHHHHHIHHYSTGYEPTTGADRGSEKGFSFGLGFGLDSGVESVEVSGSGMISNGVVSDVFGPLPGHDEPQSQLVSTRSHTLRLHRKPQLSPATLAGLRRKELIRNRKKQLEVIMGDLPASDSFALDHALSKNFPPLLSSFTSPNSSPNSPATDTDHGHSHVGPTFVRTGGKPDETFDVGWGWGGADGKEVRVKLSKRAKIRAARAVTLGRLGRHPDAAPFPTREFTYSLASATAERLVNMQQEVTKLRSLFATELARQTAKAAEMVVGTGKSGGGGPGKSGKRRAQQRARTIMNAKSGEQQAEFLEMPQQGTRPSAQPQTPSPQISQTQSQGQTPTPKKGKKKKRSTMANASNPHHLRNYVPSRLPHAAGGGGSTGMNHGQGNQTANASLLWPLALKFLSADLPPRRRKDTSGTGQSDIGVQSLPQLVVPQEEWICSFCEYSLFYGEDAEYRRAIRNRKKVLKRRRRARERAAAAASGVNAAMKNAVAPGTEKTHIEDEEYDDQEYESVPNSVSSRVDGTGNLRNREPPG
ncbi:hypothetical protein D9756_002673 [Leucocoprinus leucothites]|uniref:Uncharacterized protein n=1 Tax=Leucocoprinus leucothites TaxID=201217 RepID=A0A8H5LMF3_9AGAR|nr:hypothetical protein D9756_002673 [Leucoagaricus leucothites]